VKTKKRSSASSNILRYIWGSALATIFLTTILSFWLLSGSWGTWKSAHNNVIQFDIFYRVLQVSNDLAGERAFVNELILSSPEEKESRWQVLVAHRDITDRDMQKIPKNLLSPALMGEMMQQLERSRRVADGFRTEVLSDPKSQTRPFTIWWWQRISIIRRCSSAPPSFCCWSPARWGRFCARRRWASCAMQRVDSVLRC
jgi:hypothetical protein